MFGVILLAASVGMGLGLAHAALIRSTAEALDGFDGEVAVELVEDSANHGFGESALARIRTNSGVEATLTVKLGDGQPLLAGERLTCSGSFKAADYAQHPYAWNEGSCGSFKANSLEKAEAPFLVNVLVDARKRAIAAIGDGDDQHRLLQALVCGYRRNIRGSELYSQFQTCGLAHLVAVSGAHLVIVTGLFASLLKALRMPRFAVVGVLVAVMASYFIVAGMPVSALRAAIMSSLGLLAFFGKRRASSLNAVGIGIFGIVILSPPTCLSASFTLSALSTIGIVLFAPLFQAWLERTPLVCAPFALEALALTMSAGLLSQLYACSLFNQLPLVAPFANVVCAPLFPVACGTGLATAMAALALPAASTLLSCIAGAVSAVLSGIVGFLAAVPRASVPISIDTLPALAVSAGAALLLWLWWPRRAGAAAPAIGAVVIAFAALFLVSFDASDRIVMLDVGQGDAVLVQSRGQSMLVDTGNQDSRLLEQLGFNRISHLDSVQISHADDDHCGSLDALRRAVDVDRVILAQDMLSCEGPSARSLKAEAEKTADDISGVELGDAFSIGAFTAHVVWPGSFTEEGGNADSLCVLLDYDGDGDGRVDCTALMTGDAEKDQLATMINEGSVGHVDILKVGHHGSRNGSTAEEMRVLSPRIALISCGANNRYGHPTSEILDMLGEVGATTFRTDENGEVRCMLSPSGVSVSCME